MFGTYIVHVSCYIDTSYYLCVLHGEKCKQTSTTYLFPIKRLEGSMNLRSRHSTTDMHIKIHVTQCIFGLKLHNNNSPQQVLGVLPLHSAHHQLVHR